MVILRFCTIYFFSHLPLRDFFSTSPITFLMVRPSVLRVKSRLLSPLPGWSHVLLNRHSIAPVYRHFVKCIAPRGLRAVKSALNPGLSRVKPPLCPRGSGAGFSIDWCIIAGYIVRWDRQNLFVIAGFVSTYFTAILPGFQMLFVIPGSSL